MGKESLKNNTQSFFITKKQKKSKHTKVDLLTQTIKDRVSKQAIKVKLGPKDKIQISK